MVNTVKLLTSTFRTQCHSPISIAQNFIRYMNSGRNCWKINRNLRLTVDNLQKIRADLVKIDNEWKQRKFPKLVEALEN